MPNNSKLFRKSINGYNKEDVNSYIVKTDKEFARKESDLKDKIDELNARIAELESSNKELSANLESANNDNEFLKSQINELSELNNEVIKKVGELEEKVSMVDFSPSANNDSVKSKIDSFMQNADYAAESIKNKALEEARILKEMAENKANEIKTSIQEKADTAISGIADDIKTVANDSLKETMISLNDIKTATNDLIRRIDEKNAELNNRIEFFKNASKNEIKNKIDNLDLHE